MIILSIANLFNYLEQLGYLGAFIISVLGTLSIIFPIPYLITIYVMATTELYNPIILGCISGLGATIGEITLYILARMGRFALSEKKLKEMDMLRTYLDRYGWIAVFVFAATPLPDDILYPLLGLIRYDATKLFISCFLGKSLLSTLIAYAGILSIDVIDYFVGESSICVNIAMLIVIIISVVIILKIDWTKLLMKMVGER